MRDLSLFAALFLIAGRATADVKIEAENAKYSNCKVVYDSRYSGGRALELTENNASISFTYTSESNEKHNIFVGYDGLYGNKMVNLSVNGNVASFSVKGLGETEVGSYIMKKGSNSIVITPNWTWFRIDYIIIKSDVDNIEFNISKEPVDKQATESCKTLYTFLYDNFGKRTISGMMTGDMTNVNKTNVTQHPDVKAVKQISGKTPALIGFDFMNTTGLKENDSWYKEYSQTVMTLAKDTYKRGGIPAFTWHWRDPSRQTEAFYTSDCTMKISDAMNSDGSWDTSSQLYQYIIKDIDAIANCLLQLQREDMACIFRPLHEASGGWFWWGREGAEQFIKLYRLIFDEMVNVKGVHNVIWVWNAGDNDSEWNPGENYFDVVSADIYNADYDYSSNYVSFDKLKGLTGGKKIIALSENGPIPDINKQAEEDAMWSWWMPWYQTWNGKFVDKTSAEEWTKCMNDSRIITMEDHYNGWEIAQSIRNIIDNYYLVHKTYNTQGQLLSIIPSNTIFIKGGKKYFMK